MCPKNIVLPSIERPKVVATVAAAIPIAIVCWDAGVVAVAAAADAAAAVVIFDYTCLRAKC